MNIWYIFNYVGHAEFGDGSNIFIFLSFLSFLNAMCRSIWEKTLPVGYTYNIFGVLNISPYDFLKLLAELYFYFFILLLCLHFSLIYDIFHSLFSLYYLNIFNQLNFFTFKYQLFCIHPHILPHPSSYFMFIYNFNL